MTRYPWQSPLWERFISLRERMPHALLLYGSPGIGKLDFATDLAQALLCESPNEYLSACQGCSSCRWFTQGNHPDFRLLTPQNEDEKPTEQLGKNARSKQIRIEQIRELSDFLALASHRHGARIVLLHPAEDLNLAASNALLKELEEPSGGVIFILVTHQLDRLLPTILSRCHKISMPAPDTSSAVAWLSEQEVAHAGQYLAYTGGNVLRTLQTEPQEWAQITQLQDQLAQRNHIDTDKFAQQGMEKGIGYVVEILYKWIYDILSVLYFDTAHFNVTQLAELKKLATEVRVDKLLEFQRNLNTLSQYEKHTLNIKLQIESLILQYTQIFKNTP